jgi:hypothetical protein
MLINNSNRFFHDNCVRRNLTIKSFYCLIPNVGVIEYGYAYDSENVLKSTYSNYFEGGLNQLLKDGLKLSPLSDIPDKP